MQQIQFLNMPSRLLARDDAAPLHFAHSACVIVALLVAAALIRMNEHFAVYW